MARRHFLGALLAGLLQHLPLQAQGFCESHSNLISDGFWFMFELEFKFARLNPVGDTEILRTENDAFQLFVHNAESVYYNKLNFKMFTVLNVGTEGTGGGNVIHTLRLAENEWHSVKVTKEPAKICMIVDGTSYCRNKQAGVAQAKFQMKEPGNILLGAESNVTGLEVRGWRTASAKDHYSYTEAYNGSYVTYYLVSVNSGKPANANDPLRDPWADTSDPALGHYVKPRWGTFQRLRMECGYKLFGNLGFIEAKGTWTWEAPAGYLKTEGTPVKVGGNSTRDPNLPGLPGPHATASLPWSDHGTGWYYPTFGVCSWWYVDQRRWVTYAHACDPQADTSRSSWTNWQDSPYGDNDHRYVRLWLGVEHSGTMTTTTTWSCTT